MRAWKCVAGHLPSGLLPLSCQFSIDYASELPKLLPKLMPTADNRSWNLEAFLDSLILELDKAQDALAVKGINRKLTYTVQDMALELQIFPEFDGDQVRFTTAKPGQTGASKVSIQLGSIRDTQIQEVARTPSTADVSLDVVGVPETERKELKRLGIDSAEDLRRAVEDRKVNLNQVTTRKVDYGNLARLIERSRRKSRPPRVARARVARATSGQTVLMVDGENLAIAQASQQFPFAALNKHPIQVLNANDNHLELEFDQTQLKSHNNQLQIALDPYAIIKLELMP